LTKPENLIGNLAALAIPNSSTRSPYATELTFDCNNSVINLIVVILSRIAARHDTNICAAVLAGDGGVIASASLLGANSVGPGQGEARKQHSPNQAGLKPASRGEPRADLVQGSGKRKTLPYQGDADQVLNPDARVSASLSIPADFSVKQVTVDQRCIAVMFSPPSATPKYRHAHP
jgi:hypothetical protein